MSLSTFFGYCTNFGISIGLTIVVSFQIYVGMTIVCRPRFMVGTAIVRSFHTYLSEDHTIKKLQSEVEETDLQSGKIYVLGTSLYIHRAHCDHTEN